MAQTTVAPNDFQAAASQDGANSRVITDVSWDNGPIFYRSYGWGKDTTTVYAVQTATATFDNVISVAQQLAADGYIITAIGGTAADGLLLVGTRIQGDSEPRSILATNSVDGQSPSPLYEQGHAIVGFLINGSGTGLSAWDYIGERSSLCWRISKRDACTGHPFKPVF
jgi:hypothetical protein